METIRNIENMIRMLVAGIIEGLWILKERLKWLDMQKDNARYAGNGQEDCIRV